VSPTQLEVGTSTSSALNCRIITLSNHDLQQYMLLLQLFKIRESPVITLSPTI